MDKCCICDKTIDKTSTQEWMHCCASDCSKIVCMECIEETGETNTCRECLKWHCSECIIKDNTCNTCHDSNIIVVGNLRYLMDEVPHIYSIDQLLLKAILIASAKTYTEFFNYVLTTEELVHEIGTVVLTAKTSSYLSNPHRFTDAITDIRNLTENINCLEDMFYYRGDGGCVYNFDKDLLSKVLDKI